jgi:hypothetical protein
MISILGTSNAYAQKVSGITVCMLVDASGTETVSRWLEVNCDAEWHIAEVDRSSPEVGLAVIAVVFDSESDRDVCYLRFV